MPYARVTDSGTSSLASAASARVAAISISSLIFLARTSSAPRKMNGNPSTLFTWFGKSDRPVATIASGPGLLRLVGHDLGCRIGEREDHRLLRHSLQHVAGHDA